MTLDCPHLPTTGRVYRLRATEILTRGDAQLGEYRLCARCYDAVQALLPRERTPGPWHLTQHAVDRFVHLLSDSRRDRSQAGNVSRGGAERRLLDLVPTARYRETDSQGRELWRSPDSAYGLRWVVSYERRPEGPLPQVVWVGQGRPPEKWWTA